MTNRTKKRIWPVALMSLAVFGLLAMVVTLSLGQPSVAQADNPCQDQGLEGQALFDCVRAQVAQGHDVNDAGHTHPTPTPTPTPMPMIVLTAPSNVSVSPLDNTMTVRWSAPQGYDDDATLTGYKITQTHVPDPNSPVTVTSEAAKEVEADVTEVYFWGLSYGAYYSHTVTAMYRYEDAAGKKLTGMRTSAPVTKRTADSGGILLPAETPPSMPRNLTANKSVPEAQICKPITDSSSLGHVKLTWAAPSDAGQGAPPNLTPGDCQGGCTNVTPPHTGGDNAGITLLGTKATIVSYKVDRRTAGGSWTRLATVTDHLAYTDTTVMSGMTYEYRVSALNSVQLTGAWAMTGEIGTDTMVAPPERPSSLVATIKDPIGDDPVEDVELQWDPPMGDWRSIEDSGADHDSEKVAYCIQRRAGEEAWDVENTHVQPHKYSPDGVRTVLTQEYTDGDAPEGEVAYRVAAVFAHVEADGTVVSVKSGPSLWNEAEEVETDRAPQPRGPLGNPIGLAAALSTDPFGAVTGDVTITWTAAANADAQWVWAHDYAIGEGRWVARVAGDAGSATVTGLASGSYAFIALAGQEADGNWEYSKWEDSNWSGIVTVE